MSEEKSQQPKQDGNQAGENKAENKDNKNPSGDDEDEEDEGYSCKKCWYGYCACVVWTCKCIYNCILGIKNGIVCCCAACWYPLKERCLNCSDCCDKKMNPYKDPQYKEYDHL